MNLRIIIYLCLIFTSNLFSQTFSGIVLDNSTKKQLPNCIVVVKGKTISTITDNKGQFKFPSSIKNKNTSIVLSMLGYTTIEYKLMEYPKDTFYISPKNFLLDEVVISANKKNILNPKSEETILDFDIMNDHLVVLTAGNKFNNLKMMNEYGDNITQLKVNKNTEKLKYDCLDNLHVFSPDSTWQLFYDFEKLNLLNPYSLANFNQILGHCVCSNNNNYYFQNLTYRNLRTEYFYYNENQKGVRHNLVKFQDSAKIKNFELDYNLQYFLTVRRESNYTKYNESVDTMIKHLEKYREGLPLDWAYNKWLGSVETEMLKIDTNLFIVNFTDTSIYAVDSKNEIKFNSKFPILYRKNLTHKVYKDADYKETYLIQFLDNKLVAIKFDIHTGKELSKTEIPNIPFLPKKIIIHSRRMYFIQKNLVDEQAYKIIKYYLD